MLTHQFRSVLESAKTPGIMQEPLELVTIDIIFEFC